MTRAGRPRDDQDRRQPDRRRLAALRAAGLVDSAGLALGWTIFTLYAARAQGLPAVGLYHGAMYVGVALSSWFTVWLTRRVDGRRALRVISAVEACLRVAGFLLLLAGAPPPAVAAAVLVQNLVAWTGYAIMRSEVAAVDGGSASLTWYGVCIGGTEAAAAAVAVFLPVGTGQPPAAVVLAVSVAYAACLLPTWLVARDCRTQRVPPTASAPRPRVPFGHLGGGAAIMLLAAGPTLLAVPLADEIAGQTGVVVGLLAFTAGAFVAPRLAHRLERLSPRRAWPLLGTVMAAGWLLAPVHLAGLVAAQVLSGAALTAFEGSMDARLHAHDSSSPFLLAAGASARAIGGAAAVVLLPLALHEVRLPWVSLVVSTTLVLGAVAPTATRRLARARARRSAPARTHVREDLIAA